jgi:hypothetical protein
MGEALAKCMRRPIRNVESVNLDPYLSEALLSQRNRIDIALLLFQTGKSNLMPSILEDIMYFQQAIIDKYCIAEVQDD